MAEMLPLEENKNEGHDSVLESGCIKADGKKRFSVADCSPVTCRGGRAASLKLCMLSAIIFIITVPLISLIIWLYYHPYSCPRWWIGFEGVCYHFSEGEGDWMLSRDDCRTRGASLAVIQSEKQLGFVLRYKGPADHWIGLSRQNPGKRWQWDDGTEFNSSLFPIGGGENFAFLNNEKVSSARSTGERHWICTKAQSRWP